MEHSGSWLPIKPVWINQGKVVMKTEWKFLSRKWHPVVWLKDCSMMLLLCLQTVYGNRLQFSSYPFWEKDSLVLFICFQLLKIIQRQIRMSCWRLGWPRQKVSSGRISNFSGANKIGRGLQEHCLCRTLFI